MKHIRKGKRERKERGQSLTEVAIALPVILLILAGVLDLGRLYYVTVALNDASGEGATYAAINPNATDEIIARTLAASDGMVQIEADKVTIDCPVMQPGMPITVIVEYDFTVSTPILNAIVPGGVLQLRGVSVAPILTGEM